MSSETLSVAAIQAPPVFLNRDASLEKAARPLRQAEEIHVSLLIIYRPVDAYESPESRAIDVGHIPKVQHKLPGAILDEPARRVS